jgi:hypothetical protein
MTGVTNTELALAIQQVIARVDAREDELKDWQSGPFDGGPFGDGRYQITNIMGEVGYFKSPARLAYEVGLLTTAADGALAQVLATQDAIEAAASTVDTRATAATSAATVATTKASEADTFRQQAANSEANALVHRNAAQTAASSAATDRGLAVSARDAAQLAQAGAQSARTEAQTFRNEAQTARDQAQAFAASINPATLATKAELQAELNALVGAAPGTLNTLNELAAALGNNPNFAATVTAQIAGKANTVHTHVIGDITGLQTALDGKAALSHTHTISQVTGLQTALDGKSNVGHGHVIADVSGLQGALDAKQNSLGFTPVQQGGGPSQGNNKLRIGWAADGSGLRLQVDSTDFGKVWPIDINGTAAAVAWSGITGRPSTFTPSAHSHSISDVTGLQSMLDNRMLRGVDQWLTSTDGRSRFFFANNGRSFFGSPNGYEFRNASDQNIMEVWNGGEVFFKGNGLWLEGPSPTMWWRDSNHRAFGIHVNDDLAYFMRGGTNDPNWSALSNGQWPMVLNLNNGDVTFGRNIGVTENIFAPSVWLGDDAVLGDVNMSNTVCIRGQQNGDRGYIQFGIPGASSQLGAVAGGALTYNGNTVWHSGNFDPNSRVALSSYTGSNQSLTANGYQRLPGGLILQWGSVFIAGNGSATVTYPISFPNAAFIVMADGGETVTNRQDNGPAVTSFNNFNASITNGIDVGISTRWFAIGW